MSTKKQRRKLKKVVRRIDKLRESVSRLSNIYETCFTDASWAEWAEDRLEQARNLLVPLLKKPANADVPGIPPARNMY